MIGVAEYAIQCGYENCSDTTEPLFKRKKNPPLEFDQYQIQNKGDLPVFIC